MNQPAVETLRAGQRRISRLVERLTRPSALSAFDGRDVLGWLLDDPLQLLAAVVPGAPAPEDQLPFAVLDQELDNPPSQPPDQAGGSWSAAAGRPVAASFPAGRGDPVPGRPGTGTEASPVDGTTPRWSAGTRSGRGTGSSAAAARVDRDRHDPPGDPRSARRRPAVRAVPTGSVGQVGGRSPAPPGLPRPPEQPERSTSAPAEQGPRTLAGREPLTGVLTVRHAQDWAGGAANVLRANLHQPDGAGSSPAPGRNTGPDLRAAGPAGSRTPAMPDVPARPDHPEGSTALQAVDDPPWPAQDRAAKADVDAYPADPATSLAMDELYDGLLDRLRLDLLRTYGTAES